MFTRAETTTTREMAPGVQVSTLCHGERVLMTRFRLTAGHELPRHSHVQEQTGYLVSGRILLSIGDEEFDAAPGSSWCIGSGVYHGAMIVEDSIAIEVFSPVREDLLPVATPP